MQVTACWRTYAASRSRLRSCRTAPESQFNLPILEGAGTLDDSHMSVCCARVLDLGVRGDMGTAEEREHVAIATQQRESERDPRPKTSKMD